MFTKPFDKYVCMGDTIETSVNGFDIVATLINDDRHSIDDDDCHSTDQSVTGCDDTQFAKLLANRKAYHQGEWGYCGIVLSVSYRGVELSDHAASLWGIEYNYPDSDNAYLLGVANELLDEALDDARTRLTELRRKLCG